MSLLGAFVVNTVIPSAFGTGIAYYYLALGGFGRGQRGVLYQQPNKYFTRRGQQQNLIRRTRRGGEASSDPNDYYVYERILIRRFLHSPALMARILPSTARLMRFARPSSFVNARKRALFDARAVMRRFLSEAKAVVPVDTGRLRYSLSEDTGGRVGALSSTVRSNIRIWDGWGGPIITTAWTNVRYAPFVHYKGRPSNIWATAFTELHFTWAVRAGNVMEDTFVNLARKELFLALRRLEAAARRRARQ